MKRVFKFRIWDGKNKSWLTQEDWVGINNYGVIVNDHEDMNDLSLGENKIIQQFTGLKDKNDKDIYEGDIVRVHRLRCPDKHREGMDFSKLPWPENHWYDSIEIGQIRWSDVSCGFVEDYEHIRYDDVFPLMEGTEHRYEIIGNIFENPELLK